MADSIEVILHDLGSRLVQRGADVAFGAAAERVDSPMARAALGVAEALVDEYGDDAVDALLRAIHRRQARRVGAIVDDAQRRNDEARDEALERLERDQGGGHE